MTLLSELEKEYSGKRIPYFRLLETKEWDLKRSIIIRRDKEECTNFHNKTTEYLLGKHVWWHDYIGGIKQPNKQFWEKLDYYEKLLGDKFAGISANNDDYEIVPEEMSAAIVVGKQYYLQVHHKYYVDSKFPWEYYDDALITLCNWCHFELHQTNLIPIFTEINGQLMERKLTPCAKCNGAGYFPEFQHVKDGICFRCTGQKYDELIAI